MQDECRLNVAITRAKHKLLVIGDAESLKIYKPFEKLLDVLHDHQIYKVEDGKDGFCWPEDILSVTQTQRASPVKRKIF